MSGDVLMWMTVALVVSYIIGIISAFDAILNTRTAQGATAWVLALLLIPFIALPFYRIFGRSKFAAYRNLMSEFDQEFGSEKVDKLFDTYEAIPDADSDVRTVAETQAFAEMARMPFTHSNSAELLIDGKATFAAIFDSLKVARNYVLIQFYIIRDDQIGAEVRQALLDLAQRGVRVYLLYDDIGSHGLGDDYLRPLRDAGVVESRFGGDRSIFKRFRLNFRNHRKIIVIDGTTGFVGGLNVGDEYLGNSEAFPHWRDTHCRIVGPAVLELQISFLRDWYYAQKNWIDVDWVGATADSNQQALVMTTGPADPVETCGLMFTHAIASAERRVWIATPYFVPDGRVLGALQIAALRGCDVRVLMPRVSDSKLFKFVPFAYVKDVEQVGVKVHLYEPGFMHQKVMLIDDDFASVGTANLDTRSFLLNFESTCLVKDPAFSKAVEKMLIGDFEQSTVLTVADLDQQNFIFRLAVQTTRLLAPVL